MKFSARTIVILAVLGLAISNPAPAQNASTCTISGQVGVIGVKMQGLPGNPISDSSGQYSVLVESGWSGTITPVKEGYIFEPASKTYNNVVSNQNEQNYHGEILTFTISGNTRTDGVKLIGLPGEPVTDYQGNYSCAVPYGWAGTVKPEKEGYTLDPPYRIYEKVVRDCYNQNYTLSIMTFTISGDVGQPGVLMRGLPGDPISGREGKYSVTVEYGWSGTVEAFKEGFSFTPPQRRYNGVREHYPREDYFPTQVVSVQAFRGSGDRKTIVIPTSEVKTEEFETMMEDMQVMLHIFEQKIINEPSMIRGILTDYGDIFGRDNQSSKAIYIQDYGVLFLMEVDFPLVFQSKPESEQPAQPREDVDPVWRQAREQVFSPKDDAPGMITGTGSESMQQSIEQLKIEFIRALKHASNIRNLGQDECVILNVTGQGPRSVSAGTYGASGQRIQAGGRIGRGSRGLYGGRRGSETEMRRSERGTVDDMYGGRMMGGYGGGMMGGYDVMTTSTSSSTVLTIHASKLDIDAFAEDKINFDEFQSKVQVFVY